ncbi:hypothetical protein D3C86_1187470 [compost metagenome]
MLGGLRGQRRVLHLLFGHVGGFQQLQHAQYAVHRRAQFMAHHGEEVGFGVVGLFRFFAGLDQLRHGLMLFAAGLLETAGEVVDVLRQRPQLGVVDNRQRCFVVAVLDRLDRIADITDRLRQAARQTPRQEEGKQQGKQGQNGGLEYDFLLAPAEGIVGQPDDHPAEIVFGGGRAGGFAALEKIVVQRDALEPYRCLEHFELLRAIVVFARLFDVHQNPAGAVLDFQKAHVRRGQCGLEQSFEHFDVARNHAVLGGRGQLIGDQLAGVGDFLTQILDAHEREETDQQQGQQQCRAEADQLGASVDVPATAQAHGRRSPSASSVATDASFICSIPNERATCGLLATLNRWG